MAWTYHCGNRSETTKKAVITWCYMKLGGKESWILISFIPSFAIAKITFYDTILTPEFGFPVFSGEMFYLVG